MQLRTYLITIAEVDMTDALTEASDRAKVPIRQSHGEVAAVVSDTEIGIGNSVAELDQPIHVDAQGERMNLNGYTDATVTTIAARLLKQIGGRVE